MPSPERVSKQASLFQRRSRRDEEVTDATLNGSSDTLRDEERRRSSLVSDSTTLPRSADEERRPCRSLPNTLKASLCTFEGARDFLARERTFFVWLRLSTTLMVLAGAILLRLQIRDTKKAHDPSEASLTMSQRRAVRRILQIRLAQLLSNSTTTPTPTPAPLDLTLSPHSHSFLNPSSSSIDPLSPPTEPRSYFPLSPNLPIPSIFLGALFSLLTLLALGVGLYDFLRCSRCLEHFDHFGAISASEGFGHGPINPSSSAGAGAGAEPGSTQVVVESGVPEGYDAAKAVEAHSGRVVHLTTVLIAGSILIVAVLFVIDEFLS